MFLLSANRTCAAVINSNSSRHQSGNEQLPFPVHYCCNNQLGVIYLSNLKTVTGDKVLLPGQRCKHSKTLEFRSKHCHLISAWDNSYRRANAVSRMWPLRTDAIEKVCKQKCITCFYSGKGVCSGNNYCWCLMQEWSCICVMVPDWLK